MTCFESCAAVGVLSNLRIVSGLWVVRRSEHPGHLHKQILGESAVKGLRNHGGVRANTSASSTNIMHLKELEET